MIKDDSSLNEKIKIYEIGYLLLPAVDEDGVLKEVNNIKDIIEKNKGIFLSEGVPEMRNLAYSMKKSISGKNQKFDTAYFGWVKFEATSDIIREIKDQLDKIENILRYLLINTIKEDVMVATKVGKFSFGKKNEKKKQKVVKDEEKKEKSVDPKTEKELDETIDELVIE